MLTGKEMGMALIIIALAFAGLYFWTDYADQMKQSKIDARFKVVTDRLDAFSERLAKLEGDVEPLSNDLDKIKAVKLITPDQFDQAMQLVKALDLEVSLLKSQGRTMVLKLTSPVPFTLVGKKPAPVKAPLLNKNLELTPPGLPRGKAVGGETVKLVPRRKKAK